MHELKAGGAEKLLIDILKRVDFSKYEISLLLIEKTGIYVEKIPSNVKVSFIFQEGEKPRRIFNTKLVRNIYRKMLLWLRLPKFAYYDTIISFMEGDSLRYHSLITNRARNNVSWVHIDLKQNHWSLNYFWDREEELCSYKLMNSVIFVSEQAKNAFHDLYPDVENLRVILNLIDKKEIVNKASREVVSRPDNFLICGVGRLVEQKRFDRFIDVINELENRGHDVSGWIIGEGSLRKNLEIQATVTGNVKLLGFKENPFPYVNIADLFLLTSDSEGFSLVVAEAMALGKVIVSTNVTGPAELLSGNAGIITGFDVKEIADSIETVILDKNKANKYSINAAKRADGFDVLNTMSQIYQVFDNEILVDDKN